MNMNRIQRLLPAIVAISGLLGHAAVASATANHHDARQLLGDNIKHDGLHPIDKKGKYSVSAEVRGGKIAGVHVNHTERGVIAVKKYKTNHKMAQAGRGHIWYVAFVSPQDQDLGTVYIGYSYVDDDGNEQIYWYPEEMILDGDTGAIEYVPTS
jgi:hypothetical protein